METKRPDQVRLRVHLNSAPPKVFDYLATDAGRAAFWAESAVERGGRIDFRFANGFHHQGRVLACEPPRRFAVEYFDGSRAQFDLVGDGAGGTDLTLVESAISQVAYADQRAGWVVVLLALKAAADFSIDLRNRDPDRTWEKGYVDV